LSASRGRRAVWRRISGAVLPGLQDIEKKGVSPWRISLHLSPDRGRDTTPGRGWVTQYPVRPSGWQKCQDWRVVGNSICTPGRRGGKSGQIASCPGGERRDRNTPGDGGLQGSVNKFLLKQSKEICRTKIGISRDISQRVSGFPFFGGFQAISGGYLLREVYLLVRYNAKGLGVVFRPVILLYSWRSCPWRSGGRIPTPNPSTTADIVHR
jgi:hypothetical protein